MKSSTRPSTPWSLVCFAASEPAKSVARRISSINSSPSVWDPTATKHGLAVFSRITSLVPSCKETGEEAERRSRLTVKPLNSRLLKLFSREENVSKKRELRYNSHVFNSEILRNTIEKSIRKKKKYSTLILLTFPQISLLYASAKDS
jgi:hypothetical protein